MLLINPLSGNSSSEPVATNDAIKTHNPARIFTVADLDETTFRFRRFSRGFTASRRRGGPPDAAVMVAAKTGRSNRLEVLEKSAVKMVLMACKRLMDVQYLIKGTELNGRLILEFYFILYLNQLYKSNKYYLKQELNKPVLKHKTSV